MLLRFPVSAAMALTVLILLTAGCAPQVRYTREKPAPRPPAQQPNELHTLAPQPLTPDHIKHKKGSYKLLEQVVNSYLGVPYRWGGTTGKGFDCSGFVIAVYREVYDAGLPRTSSAMWKLGRQVPISAAKPGDLVFFKGGSFSTIDHVGIYMGHNRFVHSSTSSGVIYSDLKETYYARRFAGIRRML